MEKNRTKLEKYKGIDLFFDKQDSQIYFGFEGVERRVKYVFEAYQVIDMPVWEDCDLKGLFIDGTFDDYVGKAIATRKNIKTKKPEWKYKGRFDSQYKLPNYGDGRKVFMLSKENIATYKEYEEQRDVVLAAERKLKQIISKLN